MFKPKRREESLPGRIIPEADISDFQPPALIKPEHLKGSDIKAISHLYEEFSSTGVIERQVSERNSQSLEELNAIVQEAAANAKYERDLNPEYYDRELDESLSGDLSAEDDWDNPILDGIDDYGNRIYDDYSRKISE